MGRGSFNKQELEELNQNRINIRRNGISTTDKRQQLNNKKYKRKEIPLIDEESGRDGSTLNNSNSGSSGGKRILPQGEARVNELINPNRLRIIGGTAKGKKLESPDVYLRPMMAKVREALFSTLKFIGLFDHTPGSNTDIKVLDLFSGSGSVGLEALSRGADFACFVDLSSNCIDTVLKNANSCKFDNNVLGVCARAEQVLKNPENYNIDNKFDLISITPPYEEVLYDELIDAACNSPIVKEDTILVLEYPIEMGNLPQILGDNKFFGIRNRKYGRTMLAMYVYRPNKTYDMRIEEFA